MTLKRETRALTSPLLTPTPCPQPKQEPQTPASSHREAVALRGDRNGRGVNTRPESLELQLPHTAPADPNSEVFGSHFSLLVFLPCLLAANARPSPLCDRYLFPNLCWKQLWAGLGVGMRQEEIGEEEVSWVLGRTGSVGGDSHYQFSGHTETDRMDFLRLHLPGLHQALRGALVRGAKRSWSLSPCSLGPHLPFSLCLSSDPDSFPGSGSLLAQSSLDFNPPIPANISTDLSSRPFPPPSADPVLLLPPDPRTPLSYPECLWPRAPRERAGPPLNAFCLPPSFFLGLSQYLCFLPYRR